MIDTLMWMGLWAIWPVLGYLVTKRWGRPLDGFFWGLLGPIGFIVVAFLLQPGAEEDEERTSSSWVRCGGCGMPVREDAGNCQRCGATPG